MLLGNINDLTRNLLIVTVYMTTAITRHLATGLHLFILVLPVNQSEPALFGCLLLEHSNMPVVTSTQIIHTSRTSQWVASGIFYNPSLIDRSKPGVHYVRKTMGGIPDAVQLKIN